MSEMDRLIEVIGMLVATDSKIVHQNDRILKLLEEREGLVREELKQSADRFKAEAERVRLDLDTHAKYIAALQYLGIGEGDMHVLSALEKLGVYEEVKAMRERLKKRAVGSLPEGEK